MRVDLEFKQAFVAHLSRALIKRRISQSDLARKMKTSRAVVHRMLKPDDTSLTMSTMSRAAEAVGCRISFRFV